MATYDLLANLPLTIDGYGFEPLEMDVSSGFLRKSTVIRLRGGGAEGIGEDVTYDNVDHEIQQAAGPTHDLAAARTVGEFSEIVGALDLFPETPQREVSRLYRRWAFESAALDLALRQAGRPLHDVLGRPPRPLTFVLSLRLGEPPSMDPVRSRLADYPGLRFKLDPTPDWDEALISDLVATRAVDSVDFKGLYKGTVVDAPADPVLYRRVAEAFPDAWMEDPDLEAPGIDDVLRPHRDRITWDANIHSVADIESLPFPPRMVNIKPSRFGSLQALCAGYDYCEAHGIGAYGGGQFELGPGRGQIQYLASVFHPDTPNDVAPSAYNDPSPPAGLPSSPLAPATTATGFRWE